jgi:hypothetical protein
MLVAFSAALIVSACTAYQASQPQPGPDTTRVVPAPAPATAAAAPRDLAEFIRLYQTDENGVSRFYSLPWSETRFDREERVYNEWQGRLAGADFGGLDQQGKIDAVLLRNSLRSDLSHLSLDRQRLAQMDPLLPFRATIQDLELTQWKMMPIDPEAAAARIAALPDQIKKLRDRIKKEEKPKPEPAKAEEPKPGEAKPGEAKPGEQPEPPKDKPKAESPKADSPKNDNADILVSPVLARRTAAAVGDIRGTFYDWYNFYSGYQPEFSWWLKQPFDAAAAALDDYSRFLREDIAGLKGKDEDPLVGDPIGREALMEDLKAEVIPYTPEELVAIGERELAWCEGELKKAAAEMGLGDDWKSALAKVKADHVPPGQQDALVADYSRFIIKYLKDRDLVTIPPLCEETWRLVMIPPSTQKTLPFAYYGGQHMAVAYPTQDMKHEDKEMSMRGNNRHFTRIVTPHELIPGHHLQGFMAQRERPYRQMFSTPFLVEGWALYWEMTLYDMGYPQSPEDRIGMLFWRAHRAARIIVSLKFHLGQMTPPEMIDFLVDHVGHERFGATSEVRRFIGGDYSPLYQCGYMIGGLQLRAMRRELVDSGKMTNKQFHDTILTYGPIPVELIRAGMEGLPLTREYEAGWKFDAR